MSQPPRAIPLQGVAGRAIGEAAHGLLGVLLVGFLRRDEVAARGLVFFFRRTPVRVDIAEALGDRAFLDFGGALVCDTGLVVALHSPLMRRLVALVRTLGAFGGARHVVRGDGLARGQFAPPAQQFLGAPGGLVTPLPLP